MIPAAFSVTYPAFRVQIVLDEQFGLHATVDLETASTSWIPANWRGVICDLPALSGLFFKPELGSQDRIGILSLGRC
jgi:hypothetical protein